MDKCRTVKITQVHRRRGSQMSSETVMAHRESRLEVRVSAEIKALLDEAAASVGLSTSAFVLATVTPRAREVLQQRDVMELSTAESQAFVNQLLNPPEPNAALRTAAARYWARVERSQ